MSEELLADVRRSAPGFRLSQRDVLVITVCILATVWLWDRVGELSLLMLGVLGHFFLFCNVFRVRTRYELVWAARAGSDPIRWVAKRRASTCSPRRRCPRPALTRFSAGPDFHGDYSVLVEDLGCGGP